MARPRSGGISCFGAPIYVETWNVSTLPKDIIFAALTETRPELMSLEQLSIFASGNHACARKLKKLIEGHGKKSQRARRHLRKRAKV